MMRANYFRMFVWVLVVAMIMVMMGCGGRTSHGSHRYSKHLGKPKMVVHQPTASDRRDKTGKPGIVSGEGYFPPESDTFSDLLDDDTVIQEQPHFEVGPNENAALDDYWLNRTRAEQFTAQSGLEDVHFAFNSIQLTEEAKTILRANAEWLEAHPEAEVTIEGHCDDRGTSSYNYVLGEKRAMKTKNYLASLGVASERLHVMSFGKDNPACWDPTESCYQKNRRAHMVLGMTMASTALRYSYSK